MNDLGTMQFGEGVWHLVWSGGDAYVMANLDATTEVWASSTAGFFPLKRAFMCTKTSESVMSRTAFLTWVCSQYAAGTTLRVVEQASSYTYSTQSCP